MEIQFILELLGTVAFAVSGAVLAVDREMDVFGVLVMGIVTATGGGFLRDVTLGIVPPALFVNPVFVSVGLCASFVSFLAICFNRQMPFHMQERLFRWILNFTDAIGLGLFTVLGVNAAIGAGYGGYRMFAVFLGVLTGVGGGMLRDIFAGLMPAILRKHVYACASLSGALCYEGLLPYIERAYAMLLAAIVVIAVRMLAYHFEWNMPKIRKRRD